MKTSLLWIIAIILPFFILPPEVSIPLGILILIYLIFSRRITIITYLASQAYFVKGNTDKAYKYYLKAYKTGAMKSSDKISFAAFCLYTDRLERCRRLLNEVINSSRSTEADCANAKHYMAILEWKEENLDEAIKVMEEVHEEYPQTGTYGTLGTFYIEKGKEDGSYSEHLDFMLEAYEYNSSDKNIADNLAELYLQMEEYEKAKEIYENLLSTQQLSPVPYYHYALVLKKLDNTEEAVLNLEKALKCSFNRTLTLSREDVEKELESLK